VFACKVSPCWPTLADAARLILEGYGTQLMLVRYEGVSMLTPAAVGFKGKAGPPQRMLYIFPPVWGRGRCSFLTAENRCELHAPGLKPLEGRLASHAPSAPGEAEAVGTMIIRTWANPEGRALCESWVRAQSEGRDLLHDVEDRACVESALRHGQPNAALYEAA
jgi:hypothetical protein